MGVVANTVTVMKDVRHLGVNVLGRFVNGTNVQGLKKINT